MTPAAVHAAAEWLEHASAPEVLRWAGDTFGARLAVTTSLTDAVLVHLASRVLPGVTVLFVDTGKHFPETLGTRDAVGATYDVELRTVATDEAVPDRLYETDPDRCCWLRKVSPLERALRDFDAWVTGLRRDESPQRAHTPVVQWDARRRKVKVNPLARWSSADVAAYTAEHDVLVNPLVALGYRSVGCAPCTRPVADGEDERAGRWAGTAKSECGLHA